MAKKFLLLPVVLVGAILIGGAVWLWSLGREEVYRPAAARPAAGRTADQRPQTIPAGHLIDLSAAGQARTESDADIVKLWYQAEAQKTDTGAAIKQAGEENIPDLVKNALVEKGSPLLSLSDFKPSLQYQLGDLRLVGAEDAASLKTYGQQLTEQLRPIAGLSLEYVPAIVLMAMDSKEPNDLLILTALKISHLKRAQELIKLAVPPSAGSLHLKLVNQLLALAELTFNMEKALTEPILALQSAQRHTSEYFKFLNALTELNRYFAARQVTFSAAEQVKFSLNP